MKKQHYKITEEKKFELVRELEELKNLKLKEIADRLEETRKEDLSEDDIQLGEILEEKESVENRIDEINDILANAEILVEKDYCEPYQVKLGSTVKLKQGERVFDIKLVSSLEADPEKNYISNKSPLGRVLLKSKSGDTVHVKIRDNVTEYNILDVC